MRKMGITAGVVLASCVLVTLATASSSPGTTEIQYFIVNAYNIPNRDLPGDLSDPYLVIKNRTGGTVYRSNYQDNKINATFDPVSFNVLPNEMYHIDILDRDPISDDETCGSVYVLGHSLVGSPHNLSNPSGGWVVFRWKFPTLPPTTTSTTTTTTTLRTTTIQATTTPEPTTTLRTTTTTQPGCVTCAAVKFELAGMIFAIAGILSLGISQ